MSNGHPYWRHNPALRRWELGYHDPFEGSPFPDDWVLITQLADEKIADDPRRCQERATNCGFPLPSEAFTTNE